MPNTDHSLPSSIFSLLHLCQGFCLHVLTICLAYLTVKLMFATSALVLISSIHIFSILFNPIIHLNILISVLSSKSSSAFLSSQVSLTYIRTGLMTVLYTASSRIVGILLLHVLFLTFLATFPNQLPLDVSLLLRSHCSH